MAAKYYKHCKTCKPSCNYEYGIDCDSVYAYDVKAAIRDAMREAKRGQKYYQYLSEMADCELDREVLEDISDEKKHQYAVLQSIYRDLTCRCFSVDDCMLKRPKDYCKGLRQGICAEMDFISMLERIAAALPNMCHKEAICAVINETRALARKLADLFKICEDCSEKSCKKFIIQEDCDADEDDDDDVCGCW